MVRVIAGRFKSRLLKALQGSATRPTSDRLKETLFNLLQTRIEGSRFLDCFAGTGAVGLEAISRGARSVVFIESSPPACRIIRQNMERLGLSSSTDCELLNQTVRTALERLQRAKTKFDIVFIDPPYAAADEYPQVLEALHQYEVLDEEAIIIAEHSRQLELADEVAGLIKTRKVKQGDSTLSIYTQRHNCVEPPLNREGQR
jgi:16S rRNA (guanine966-N2)-methyltransferase